MASEFTPEIPCALPPKERCWFYHSISYPDGESVEGDWDIRERFEEYVGHYPLKDKSVLDVGTASGFLAFGAERAGAVVTAMDALHASEWNRLHFRDALYHNDRAAHDLDAEKSLEYLKSGFWYSWHRLKSKVEVIYAPLSRLPYWDRKFDVVIAGALVEHLADPVTAIGNLARLAREALIIAFTPVEPSEKQMMVTATGWNNPEDCFTFWKLSHSLYERLFDNLGFDVEFVPATAKFKGRLQRRWTIIARRRAAGAGSVSRRVPTPAMRSPERLISARHFAPRKLRGLLWRGLDTVSPALANGYLDHLVRRGVARVREKPRSESPWTTVLGAFELNIGIARAAQILRVGLESADVPVHPMDCSDVLRPLPGPPRPRAAAPGGGTMVFCVNPPQMVPLLRHFGPRICRGKRLVGYWWWELDRIPRAWLPWAALMDEIWVSSRFIHDTFSRGLPGKTVRYVPLPVPEPRPAPLGRADFGLAEQAFTVLAAFDLSSHWARKNPDGAIAAFRRAFPGAGAAQLVLKVSGVDQNPALAQRLRALTADLPDVRIIDRMLPAGELAALIRCADAVLSLHRAEGFGLLIAEAMWLGAAIVATGWSGVMDMLDEDNAMLVRFDTVAVRPDDYPSVPPGSAWAEPDIGHAAECLRRLAQDRGLRERLGARARQRAQEQFSRDRFRALAPSLLGPSLPAAAEAAPLPRGGPAL